MLAAGWVACLVVSGCASPPPPKPPPTWDGLELAEREGLDSVYVRPGASLAAYKRVILRYAEVSFDQNWKPFTDPALRARKVDPNKISLQVAEAFNDIVVRELQQHSYNVVTDPDDDVLRVVPKITDLFVKFSDAAGSSDNGAPIVDTGHMTLVVELRDSLTNTALSRVVDRIDANSADLPVGSSLTGSAAAERIFTTWAIALRTALDRAHAPPPAKGKRADSNK
jgi:hypothetical protein